MFWGIDIEFCCCAENILNLDHIIILWKHDFSTQEDIAAEDNFRAHFNDIQKRTKTWISELGQQNESCVL